MYEQSASFDRNDLNQSTSLYLRYTSFFSILNGFVFVASIVSSCFQCTLDATPDTIPLLQLHYRTFIARTDRSAPVLHIGTFASWL